MHILHVLTPHVDTSWRGHGEWLRNEMNGLMVALLT
jgi:hypothetical protein